MNDKSPNASAALAADTATARSAGADDRRIHRRFAQSSLECSLGPVLDLSASGMRVIAKKPWAGEIKVRISATGFDVTVGATVMWSRRLGFRAYEMGLTFTDLDAVAPVTSWLAEWNAQDDR